MIATQTTSGLSIILKDPLYATQLSQIQGIYLPQGDVIGECTGHIGTPHQTLLNRLEYDIATGSHVINVPINSDWLQRLADKPSETFYIGNIPTTLINGKSLHNTAYIGKVQQEYRRRQMLVSR